MLRLKLHAKFLGLVLGSLVVFLGILLYLISLREARVLAQKNEEKQHLLAFTIVQDLQENMIAGTPRSTLDLMTSIKGTQGVVRLEVLRRDGSPAFGIEGNRFAIPRIEQAFAAGREISYLESGAVPLHTILYPLKNEADCRRCHGARRDILGVIVLSLSMEDTVRELARSRRDLTVLFSGFILIIGGALYAATRKVVLRPLATLHHGAEILGQGGLSHRIHIATNDEMQSLAHAFNVMAGRLEESLSGLECKVRERTALLYDAMAEVEDKAKRLYSFSRDTAAISRLSTRVFNAELSLDDLLDNFVKSITGGLGYERAMLCLVDRKKVRLEVRRDAGMGEIFQFTGQSLAGHDPFVALVRAGKVKLINDITRDDAFGLRFRPDIDGPLSLYIIPVLNHSRKKPCWQAMSCIKTECPAHTAENMDCWLVENTLCESALMESFGDKLAYCMTCRVFPVIGVLVVAADRNRRGRRGRNINVLRILAAEMGAALENHRLHEDNQRMVRELIELHTVTATALTDLSLTRALDVFTDSALKFTGLDTCNFWIVSEDRRELVHKAGGCVLPSYDDDACPRRLPVDQGLLGRAFTENRIIVEYNTAFRDPMPLGRAVAAHGLNSVLAVPLKTEGPPFGVFSVHKKSVTPFLETEIAAFMLLANQAAMVINVCMLNEELKSQNAELTRSTNLMSGILASMSSGVALLDPAGTVKLINIQGAQILGCRREEVLNRRLHDIFPGTEAFITTDVGPYREIEISRRDGTSVPIGFSSAYYHGASGEREGVIVVYRDLTELRALQVELLNNERFAAMGRVVSGVAHEIRNPLFGISSIGQIFEREIKDPAHGELAHALVSETRRLNQLVEELLIYGRPMKLTLERCDLRKLWEEVFDMSRSELKSRGITITGDYGIRHITACLDAHQIRQVFLNLLRNAVEATSHGGEISIRLLLEDRFIVFKVADSGSGIPAEHRDKVFDLFFTTKPKGTGLGLAICKKIIQDHGGEIGIESTVGKGTTVTVKLPYRGLPDER